MSLAGGFGRTCVAVDPFDFFNIKKKLVMRTHAALITYCFTYHVQFCVQTLWIIILSKYQDKQGHT